MSCVKLGVSYWGCSRMGCWGRYLGQAWGGYEIQVRRLLDFHGETWGKRHLENLGIDGRIISKWILRSAMEAWSGLVWLRIGTGGRLFLTRWWTFAFHIMQQSSWLAEDPLASQEGLLLRGVSCGIISYCHYVLFIMAVSWLQSLAEWVRHFLRFLISCKVISVAAQWSREQTTSFSGLA